MQKTKVDKVTIEQSWMGFKVTAYVDGEEFGDSPIFSSEFDAYVYIRNTFELPD